ncbi:MAG: hypothetical protein COA91_12120 [Robiginitomaculum sp.]|nr:MAG: hypothetical protein COA91_12120 [Robiginitomaculum sp.]
MTKLPVIAAVLVVGLLSACATTGEMIAPEISRINFPEINTANSVRIGESMLKKSKVYAFDALETNELYKWGDGIFLKKFTIPPQKLKATSKIKDRIFYQADEAYQYDTLLGKSLTISGFCISQDDPVDWKLYIQGRCTYGIKNPPNHSFTKAYDSRKPSLTRELVYNGRVGNDVKIIYRELSNDLMRPAFQQNLQYDMNQSKEIAFREVLIEVVTADNKEIKYVVTSHFDDVE